MASINSVALNPCGLIANSVFNDVIIVDSGPDPFDPSSPHDYMDESDIAWATGTRVVISSRILVGRAHAMSDMSHVCLGGGCIFPSGIVAITYTTYVYGHETNVPCFADKRSNIF